MGGQGSTRWGQFYERKTPVEECLLLDVSKLKAALSKLPEASSGSCRAVRISTGKLKTVGYAVDPVGGLEQEPMVTLSYALSKDYSEEGGPLVETASAYVRRDPFGPRVELRVELLSTEPNFGGRRWYFRCPLVRVDGREGRYPEPPGYPRQRPHVRVALPPRASREIVIRETSAFSAISPWVMPRAVREPRPICCAYSRRFRPLNPILASVPVGRCGRVADYP